MPQGLIRPVILQDAHMIGLDTLDMVGNVGQHAQTLSQFQRLLMQSTQFSRQLMQLPIKHWTRCLFFLKYESSQIFLEPEMLFMPALQEGVQRAVALCRGSGCPRKTSFSSCAASGGARKEKHGAQPHNPSQGALPFETPQKMFNELLKNSG